MFPYTLLLRFIGKKNFGFNQKSNAYHSAVHRLAWAVQKVFNWGQHRFRRNRGRKAAKDSPQEKYLCNQPLNQGFWTAV
jgi:hypothetical protein